MGTPASVSAARNWTLVHCHPTHPCRGRSTTAIQTPKAQTQLEFQLLADTCALSHTLYFYCDTHACLRAASRSSTEGGRKCSPTFARWLSTMLMVARYPCALTRRKLRVRTMLSTLQPSMDNRGVPWRL